MLDVLSDMLNVSPVKDMTTLIFSLHIFSPHETICVYIHNHL